MHVLAIAVLALSSLVAAKGPYGLDPTKPLNLYAYYPFFQGPEYYFNLAYLNANQTAIGLRGHSVSPPTFIPAPDAYKMTYNSTSTTLTLTGTFGGQAVSNTPTDYTNPVLLETGANKNQGGFFLFSRYQPGQAPKLYDNRLLFLVGSANFQVCKSKVFGFPILHYGPAPKKSTLAKGPCESAISLQAIPNGVRPPVNGP